MMAWGLAARAAWSLDPDGVFLNHGSYGAVSRPVQQALQDWRHQIDHNPDAFLRDIFPPALAQSRAALADFVGYPVEGLALVENATGGIQAIAQSLFAAGRIKAGNHVVTTSHVYGAVRLMLRHLCQQAGALYQEIALPLAPMDPDALIGPIHAVLQQKPALLVIDHITSPTAIIMPIADIIAQARQYDVPVLVDGAHGPGMLALDLASLKADFYVGNGHKWLGTGRGCGFVAVAPRWGAIMQPPVISHLFDRGFPDHFGWVGTRDVASWLSIPAAIAFRRQWNLAPVLAHSHDLLDHAKQFWPATTPDWGRGLMACFDLGPGTPPHADLIWQGLRHQHRIEAAIIPFDNRILLRLSGFIYNEKSDIARLAAALPDLVKKVLP